MVEQFEAIGELVDRLVRLLGVAAADGTKAAGNRSEAGIRRGSRPINLTSPGPDNACADADALYTDETVRGYWGHSG